MTDTCMALNPADSLAARVIGRRASALAEISAGFAAAIREGLCKYVVRGVVSELERHAAEGLSYEELCMARIDRNEIDRHLTEHERFRDELARLRADLGCLRPDRSNASYELSVEINRLLADWLRQHVGRMDASLVESLRKGASDPYPL